MPRYKIRKTVEMEMFTHAPDPETAKLLARRDLKFLIDRELGINNTKIISMYPNGQYEHTRNEKGEWVKKEPSHDFVVEEWPYEDEEE